MKDVNYHKEYKIRNKDKIKQQRKQYYLKNRETIIAKAAVWLYENKAKRKKWVDNYMNENKDEVNRKRREAYRKNREHTLEKKRTFYIENRSRLISKNTIATKAHRKTPHGRAKHVEIEQRRRARKANVSSLGNYTTEQWEKLKEKTGQVCVACKMPENEVSLTVDHIIPISRGGLNTIENIQPLCGPCNSSKGSRTYNFLKK